MLRRTATSVKCPSWTTFRSSSRSHNITVLATLQQSTALSSSCHLYHTLLNASSSHSVRKNAFNVTKSQRMQWTRNIADKVIKVPTMAESISEGTLAKWLKGVGDFVNRDEQIATIETDKIDVAVNASDSGTILEQFAKEGDTVQVGADFYKLQMGEAPAKSASKPSIPIDERKETLAPPTAPLTAAPTKKTEPRAQPQTAAAKVPAGPAPPKETAPTHEIPVSPTGSRTERRVKMNRMRLRIAERLKESQDTAASLTTFNQCDMSSLMEMRKKYKDDILEKYGIKLGFMSAFVKAAVHALNAVPAVNARIDGTDVVYHDFMDLSVAVSTPKGLVTPVLRNCESKSFIQIEKELSDYSKKARDGNITIEDMAGGTFTISNGGVFGSLMGTPIINQPQSAILGMHAIKDMAVVVNGQVVVRPMMYLALTYDHRIIDGREAVTFLVKVKEAVEDPRRLLLDI
ncbi:dihydrolipoyllysine-residue succinyltransferase [Synchytrium endobioticum]|uniref:dihydrolipoyllysine-residue succinyltransferase n=1 Tax=Synchytrium endobioticum TaxID=286115 RepID=A0A507CL77_9FUNG|nr:dihydrolipoyllysine-residue succinyltransferase [Synchytrium endobioticum]TPX41179.1 dihydrolipoyllysine-residue succinyltransferase [Synchytrium endobioticum]